ncbi:hypothetical protein PIROE2DRAFT_5475 [Piromyces sp. E2]|nr:hypothetical protein PIROE2DRAFT_5475 [Piromyces sp. E2]|eukprot:OUM67204.1 hypothetical protein PIROE2DRAFT_5475 [Piromyces sp. E2]
MDSFDSAEEDEEEEESTSQSYPSFKEIVQAMKIYYGEVEDPEEAFLNIKGKEVLLTLTTMRTSDLLNGSRSGYHCAIMVGNKFSRS